MDLLDRYLNAIGALLPRSKRADITAELRDILLTRREEKAEALGRPLTRGEDIALLQEFGHPLSVAGRYGPQQYLIGPELYPIYAFAVKVLVGIVAAGAVFSALVTFGINPGDPGRAFGTLTGHIWSGGVFSIGVLTVVAWLIQHYNIRLTFLDHWSPKDLPTFPRRRRETWVNHVAAVVWLTVVGLWWTGVIQLPPVNYAHASGENLTLDYDAARAALYWPILALIGGVMLVHLIRLFGRLGPRAGYGLDIVVQLFVIGIATWTLQLGHWVAVSGSGPAAEVLAKVDLGVNLGIHIAIVVIIVIAAITAVYDGWRILRTGEPV